MFTGAVSSSLLASLLLPFPVMTIIIILQQNELFCQSNTFYRVLNTHRAEARKLAWKTEMESE